MATRILTPAVAASVRAEMARKNLSQRALAEVLGITQSAVSARLRGAVAFDVDELGAVASALDIPIQDLIPQEAAS